MPERLRLLGIACAGSMFGLALMFGFGAVTGPVQEAREAKGVARALRSQVSDLRSDVRSMSSTTTLSTVVLGETVGAPETTPTSTKRPNFAPSPSPTTTQRGMSPPSTTVTTRVSDSTLPVPVSTCVPATEACITLSATNRPAAPREPRIGPVGALGVLVAVSVAAFCSWMAVGWLRMGREPVDEG